MQIDFQREREWWDAKAPAEEHDLGDEFVNRALRWREIERHLAGVRTILDVGAGTGAFSIPLAEQGYLVTHLDFSPAMIATARGKAGHLPRLRFVEANAVQLPFSDRSYDLVLNLDGAVSFCWSQAERAIVESCRVARRKLILTVSNRSSLTAVTVSASLHVTGRLVPAVYAMFDRGQWHQEEFPENPLLSKGCTQDYLGPLRAFLPAELRALLSEAGMTPLRIGGLGSLARLCDPGDLESARRDSVVLDEFIDACERFDLEILPDGPGTRQRAGLIAVGERRDEVLYA